MNAKRILLPIGIVCLAATSVVTSAAEPPKMQQARLEYARATAAGPNDEARVRYLTKLADLRYDDMARRHDGRPLLTAEQWQALDREFARHPISAKSDPRALAKLLTGKWQSPRHDYLYRADGTWTMLPEAMDGQKSTHGTWKISGHTVAETVGSQRSTDTILLLTPTYYVVSGDGTTFYRMRP